MGHFGWERFGNEGWVAMQSVDAHGTAPREDTWKFNAQKAIATAMGTLLMSDNVTRAKTVLIKFPTARWRNGARIRDVIQYLVGGKSCHEALSRASHYCSAVNVDPRSVCTCNCFIKK